MVAVNIEGPMLKLAHGMIRSYLRGFISNVTEDVGPLPPANLAACDNAVEDLRLSAIGSEEIEYLKWGLQSVLSGNNTEIGRENFTDECSWSWAELLRVFSYAYQKIFETEPFPPPPPTDIEFVDVDGHEWNRIRDAQKDGLARRLSSPRRK
jgi:hypothetical protein